MSRSSGSQDARTVPRRLRRGVFLAFEGIDGAGKTTQALLLKAKLEALGLETVYVKEPTSGRWGRKIREIARKGREGISAEEELNYFILDREEDVRENIAPALADSKVVIADRYFYSTIAYQSSLGLDPEKIRAKNAHFPVPDLVFLLEISPEQSQTRITGNRKEGANPGYEQVDFLRTVKSKFDGLTDRNIVRLDGERSMESVTGQVWAEVEALLADLYR